MKLALTRVQTKIIPRNYATIKCHAAPTQPPRKRILGPFESAPFVAYSAAAAVIACHQSEPAAAAATAFVICDNLRHVGFVPTKVDLWLTRLSYFGHLCVLPWVTSSCFQHAGTAVALALSVVGAYEYHRAVKQMVYDKDADTYVSIAESPIHVATPLAVCVMLGAQALQQNHTEYALAILGVVVAQGASMQLPFPLKYYIANGSEIVLFFTASVLLAN